MGLFSFSSRAEAAGAADTAPVAKRIKPATPPRALWIWGESRDLVRGGASGKETAEQKAFFEFIAAPHGRPDCAITTLYLGGIRLEALASGPAQQEVRAFLEASHQRGLRVEFLCGDTTWAQAAHHEEALAFLRGVIAYNRTAPPIARFDGFQYDVEPYLLKEWPDPGLRRDFLRLYDKARAEVETAKRKSGAKLILGAAIPAWFDREELGWLDRAILDRLDYLALMDYVNKTEPLIARAQNEIDYASKIGKRVVIGVETQFLKDEPEVTFFADGNAVMERSLTAAARHYKGAPGFGGFAIHYLESYRKFAP